MTRAIRSGALTVCRVETRELSRDTLGERWCFTCRRRHEFHRVLLVPADRMSYYGPTVAVTGPTPACVDMFPGTSREPYRL